MEFKASGQFRLKSAGMGPELREKLSELQSLQQ